MAKLRRLFEFDGVVAASSGLATLIVCALILHNGILMDPDGWAYWQGSVSMFDHHGYTYFYRDYPILDFVPGYSLLLGAFEVLFGPNGRTLIGVNVALAAICSTCWTLLTLWIWRPALEPLSPATRHWARAAIGVFFAGFVPLQYDLVLSDNLRYGIVPFVIFAAIKARESTTPGDFYASALVLGLSTTMLLMVHNSGVCYCLAAFITVNASRACTWARLLISGAANAIALSIWQLVRIVLGQTITHGLSPRPVLFGPGQLLTQAILGVRPMIGPYLGDLYLLTLAGVLLYSFIALKGSRDFCGGAFRNRAIAVVLFGGTLFAGLFAVFNLVWIYAQLNGRFIVVLLFLACPLGLVASLFVRPKVVALALGAMLAVLPWARSLAHITKSLQGNYGLIELGPPYRVTMIRPHYALRRDVLQPTISKPDGDRLIVSPPYYSWIRDAIAQRDSTPLPLPSEATVIPE